MQWRHLHLLLKWILDKRDRVNILFRLVLIFNNTCFWRLEILCLSTDICCLWNEVTPVVLRLRPSLTLLGVIIRSLWWSQGMGDSATSLYLSGNVWITQSYFYLCNAEYKKKTIYTQCILLPLASYPSPLPLISVFLFVISEINVWTCNSTIVPTDSGKSCWTVAILVFSLRIICKLCWKQNCTTRK